MSGLAGRHILVVEDLFYLAMDVKAVLTRAGAEVIGPFPKSETALKSLEERMPDCALLDVKLDEGTSFDLARTLRMRDIPFVFYTGYDPSAIPPEFADVLRLEKPVSPERLLQAIDACLSPSAPAVHNQE